MIKVEVTKRFTLNDFNKIKNLKRWTNGDKEGMLFVGDTFECNEDMLKYLTGDNIKGEVVVQIVELDPKKK